MDLRTRLALKLSLRFFVISIIIGLVTIVCKLPMLITSAWFLKSCFNILIISLAVGVLSFGVSWFVDYMSDQETLEKLKKLFKKPGVWGFIATVVYGIIVVKWFPPVHTTQLFGCIIIGLGIGMGVIGVVISIKNRERKKMKIK